MKSKYYWLEPFRLKSEYAKKQTEVRRISIKDGDLLTTAKIIRHSTPEKQRQTVLVINILAETHRWYQIIGQAGDARSRDIKLSNSWWVSLLSVKHYSTSASAAHVMIRNWIRENG